MARVITYPTKSATLSAVSPVLYSAQNTEVNQIYQDLNDLDAGMALKAGEASQSFAALKFTGSSTVDSTGPTDAAAAFSTLGGALIAKTAHIGGGLLQVTGANPELDIKPSSGSFASVRFYDLTNERFRVSYRSDASLFQIGRYNASGVLQENTFEIDGTTGNITARKPFHITDTTASTSTVTGAGIIDGGLGVAGSGWFGGAVTSGNTVTGKTNGSLSVGSPSLDLVSSFGVAEPVMIRFSSDSSGQNSSTPPTNSNYCYMYTFVGEIRVKDSVGNVTTISPHDKGGDEWVYKSENKETGKKVRINMEKFIHRVGELLGENFFDEFIPRN